MKFQEMALLPELMAALERLKFSEPTAIQEQAMPTVLSGRDLLGCAQTGSGKTLAYALPMLNKILSDEKSCGLILAPTRELAMQITDVLYDLTDELQHIDIACLIGGAPMFPQIRKLQRKPRLIVATPGRLNDHLERGTARINSFNMLVLDEADRMLDMGFAPQIENVISYLPVERQTLLFSATFPSSIQKLIQRYLKNPESVITHKPTDHVKTIKQDSVRVSSEEKFDLLFTEIQKREGSILVFARTRGRTEKVYRTLQKQGVQCTFIHGDRSQRERREAIEGFQKSRYRVMVATDVAARGIDISHIAHVINLDLPTVAEDYVHRIGRTGRAGASGEALSFISPDEEYLWKSIRRLMGGEAEKRSFGGGGGARGRGNKRSSPWKKKDRGEGSFKPQRWKNNDNKNDKKAAAPGASFDRSDKPQGEYRPSAPREFNKKSPQGHRKGPPARMGKPASPNSRFR